MEDAIDQATIFDTGLTLDTIFGELTGVVQILETNDREPDAREFKYYAPRFGLVRAEEGLDETFANSGQMWDPLESTCRHASLSIL